MKFDFFIPDDDPPEDMSRHDLEQEVRYWREKWREERDDVNRSGQVAIARLLTVSEEAVLRYLWKSRGRLVSRDALLDQYVPVHQSVDDRTVDSHIKRIRKKLKKFGLGDRIKISTSYGRGYFMDEHCPDPLVLIARIASPLEQVSHPSNQ